MPLDTNQFRDDKGGNVAQIREWQEKRGKPKEQVDTILELDAKWRKLVFQKDKLRGECTKKSKNIGKLKKAGEDTTALQAEVKDFKLKMLAVEEERIQVEKTRDSAIKMVGNSVHESVPVSKDEDNNIVVRTWGTPSRTGKEIHHHELLYMIDGYDAPRGVTVAGHRGYFLKGVGLQLNQALIQFALDLLRSKNYTPLQPPYFMNKNVMAETAQLEQFDEELYKVSGDGDDKYLIATSEQPISAFHRKEWLTEPQLPLKYAGFSTCFRKEAGSSGKDTWGIFRIHQFEKVEQFCITTPDKSWEMHEEMVATAEEFYQRLKIPYRVSAIVSGHLNNAAAKKLDIEAWFPTLAVFRELCSCSNCTDYQSRAMETRFQTPNKKEKQYVHMLNATLCATERTICCLLENYQCDEGVRVPECLQKYMNGMKIMPFVKEFPRNVGKEKGEKAAKKKKEEAAKKKGPKKPQEAKKGKQGSKKAGKKGKGKGGDKKPAPTAEEVAKAKAKKLKAVIKEGGKKGQDIAGGAAFGQLFATCDMEEPKGDLELLKHTLAGANKKIDPTGDDLKGGAGDVAKFLFSSSDDKVAMICHVPKALQSKLSAAEWVDHVLKAIGAGEIVDKTDEIISIKCDNDPNKGVFALKIKDSAIFAAYGILEKRQLVPDDDDEEVDLSELNEQAGVAWSTADY